jgi:hypothetical protein
MSRVIATSCSVGPNITNAMGQCDILAKRNVIRVPEDQIMTRLECGHATRVGQGGCIAGFAS